MQKVLIAAVTASLFAGGIALGSSGGDGGSSTGTSTTTETQTTRTAEQRNDRTTERLRTAPGRDVSGPCDEAEHANAPRCTGTAPAAGDRDDRSGHRGGQDDRADEDNSGPGSRHSRSD